MVVLELFNGLRGDMIILHQGCQVAQDYGYGSAIKTLQKGLAGRVLPDVIIANDYESAQEGIRLKQETGKPLIASIHLSQPSMADEKLLLEAADGIIVYSQVTRNYLYKTYDIKKPIQVVQLGIDTDLWFPKEGAEDYVLFVGRTQAPNKNFFSVVDQCIFGSIPFKIAGDLDYAQADFNLGYLTQEQLRSAYQKAALHILPSFFEPFGLVTLEAMACGCPVAVSNRSGVCEILNNDVAIIFDPEKHFSIKDMLEQAKGFDRKKISDFAKHFDHNKHADSFLHAIENIIFKADDKKELSIILNEVRRGDYSRLNVKDKVVLDFGAYVGETACYFAERGAKQVIAVEPSDNERFIYNNSLARGFKNVTPYKAAMGDDYSFDYFIRWVGCDSVVVKMDIEGAEKHLLTAKPSALKRVKEFIIETHQNIVSDIWMDLTMFLMQNGFETTHEFHGPNVGMLYAKRAA